MMQNKNQSVIANANQPVVIARSLSTKQSIQNKKNCHSRIPLSGIYNACRCKIKEISLLNRYVEDPQLDPALRPCGTGSSGMTLNLIPPLPAFGHPLPQGARKAARGFTLVELLVVVLIIGILAAVAVPQYQLLVYKMRISSWIPLTKAFKEAQEVYYLGHGTFAYYMDDLGFALPKNCTAVTHLNYARKIEITCGNATLSFAYHSPSNSWVSLAVDQCPKPDQYKKYCGTLNFPMSTAEAKVYLATTRPFCKVEGGSDVEFTRKVCRSLGGHPIPGTVNTGEVYELKF